MRPDLRALVGIDSMSFGRWQRIGEVFRCRKALWLVQCWFQGCFCEVEEGRLVIESCFVFGNCFGR